MFADRDSFFPLRKQRAYVVFRKLPTLSYGCVHTMIYTCIHIYIYKYIYTVNTNIKTHGQKGGG